MPDAAAKKEKLQHVVCAGSKSLELLFNYTKFHIGLPDAYRFLYRGSFY
jgi:hypothetical protein